MSLAFHLLAHKDPAQLGRLLHALWAPDSVYVIHYDRRRPTASPVGNDHPRGINWIGGHPSPQNFRAGALPRLLDAADKSTLFARKFDPAADPVILDALAARVATTTTQSSFP